MLKGGSTTRPDLRGCRRPEPAYFVQIVRGFEGLEDRTQFFLFVDLFDLRHQLEPLLSEPYPQHCFDAQAQTVAAPNPLDTRDKRHSFLLLNGVQFSPKQ